MNLCGYVRGHRNSPSVSHWPETDRLFGLKESWSKKLGEPLWMSFFLSLKDIFSRDLSYISVSGGWLSFFSQGGRWVLRTTIRTQPESTRGQWGLSKHGPRPDLCLHPWKPVHHGHCWHGWVCLPLPQSQRLVSVIGIYRNVRQPELKFN